MRIFDYQSEGPLYHISLMLKPEEAEGLIEHLRELLSQPDRRQFYLEDREWGELEVSVYTPKNTRFYRPKLQKLLKSKSDYWQRVDVGT